MTTSASATLKSTRLDDFPGEAMEDLDGLKTLVILCINAASVHPEGSEVRTKVIEGARTLAQGLRDLGALIDFGLGRLSGTYARVAAEAAKEDGWCECSMATRLDPRAMYCSTCNKVLRENQIETP